MLWKLIIVQAKTVPWTSFRIKIAMIFNNNFQLEYSHPLSVWPYLKFKRKKSETINTCLVNVKLSRILINPSPISFREVKTTEMQAKSPWNATNTPHLVPRPYFLFFFRSCSFTRTSRPVKRGIIFKLPVSQMFRSGKPLEIYQLERSFWFKSERWLSWNATKII